MEVVGGVDVEVDGLCVLSFEFCYDGVDFLSMVFGDDIEYVV